jgi:hypothetical protein
MVKLVKVKPWELNRCPAHVKTKERWVRASWPRGEVVPPPPNQPKKAKTVKISKKHKSRESPKSRNPSRSLKSLKTSETSETPETPETSEFPESSESPERPGSLEPTEAGNPTHEGSFSWLSPTKPAPAPKPSLRMFTLYNVTVRRGEMGEPVRDIFPDPLRRLGSVQAFDVNKYVAAVDGSLQGTLFAVDSLPERVLGPDFGRARRVIEYIKRRQPGSRSPVEVMLREGSVLKTTSLRDPAENLNEARSEVMALAMLDHIITIKRLPPWVTKMLDYGYGVNSKDHFPYTVNLVTEKADITFNKWLKRHLKNGYEKNSVDLVNFQYALDGVFAQLVLALYAFQKHAGFVHNDLHLNNVVLQQRPGTGNMRYNSEDIFYVFHESVPLMKLCDLGHSHVVHPVTRDVSPGAWFGCPLGALNNSTDLTKVCIAMARSRPSTYEGEQRLSRYSEAMNQDLDAVLRPLGDPISRCSKSMENFAFPMGAGFMTPKKLIERGSVVKRFVSESEATCANTFHELENDDWDFASSKAEVAFTSRERETEVQASTYQPASPRLGIKLMTMHYKYPQLGYDISMIAPIVLRSLASFMEKPEDSGAVMAFGGGDFARAHNACVRKRMLWSALTFYQRGVIFYMLVFAPVVAGPSSVFNDFMQNGVVPYDSGISDERAAEAVRINEMFNPELRGMNMALRYSLWAACGGFAQFFDSFCGLDSDRRHFRHGEGALDTPRAILKLYHAVTSNGWRAPIQYASCEDVHGATEETLKNAFIVSSNICYYSYTLEQALSVLKV